MNNKTKNNLEYIINLIKLGKLVIDSNGRIYKTDNKGLLYPGEHLTSYGYYETSIYLGNYKYIECFSHRIIYAYYHGVSSLKTDYVIHHIDYNKTNNQISNLAQIHRKENSSLGDGRNNNKLKTPSDFLK